MRYGAAAGINGGEVLERTPCAVAQVQEIGIGKREILNVASPHVTACQNQTVGRLIGKRMQQHSVGDAEYGSAGADAKRNCDHSGDGEYGTLSQRAERIYQVFGKHGFLNSLDQRMCWFSVKWRVGAPW